MIRSGKLCKTCKHSCQSDPREFGEIEICCVNCNGVGCDKCKDGYTILTDCPKKHIDKTTVDVLRLAESKKLGLLAIAGGILDQSASLLDAIDFYEHDLSLLDES